MCNGGWPWNIRIYTYTGFRSLKWDIVMPCRTFQERERPGRDTHTHSLHEATARPPLTEGTYPVIMGLFVLETNVLCKPNLHSN